MGTSKDEIDILYAALNKLTQASTPAEWLEAVSDYARDHGATSGILFYFEDASRPEWLESVAEWTAGPGQTGGGGVRIHIKDYSSFVGAWMATPDRPTLVSDVTTSPLIDNTTRQSYEKYGVHSVAVLPLNSKGRWVGALTFRWTDSFIFNERDQRIFTALIQQAVPVIDSVRLYDQSRERITRAELLATINAALSQATDEQGILEAVADLAEFYGAALSLLAYAENDREGCTDRVSTVALRITDDDANPTLPVALLRLKDFPLAEMAYSRPYEVIFVENMATDSRSPVDIAEALGWLAVIVLPLKASDLWQGLLVFVWNEPQTFTTEMRGLFAAVRPTAASVVNSRRAYLAQQEAHRETQLRVHELETVAMVSAAAASILDVDRLLASFSELIQGSFAQYQIQVYLLDETQEYLVRAGFPIPQIPLDSPYALVARAGCQRETIVLNEPFYEPDTLPQALPEMAVPMVVAGTLVGVLDVQAREMHRFSEADSRVMETLADLMAVAVQNARLYGRAQEIAALEERNRLARELHDSVSQAIYGIALGTRTARALLDRNPVQAVEPLDFVLSLAEAALTEMRALIFELRPESLENEGLGAVLRMQAEALEARYHVEVALDLCEEPAMTLSQKEAIYQITREALHNTVKHAHASHVFVRMACAAEAIALEISDDGLGFDPRQNFPGHLGLRTMHERAARLGGTLIINSAPGEGTCISVAIPQPCIAEQTGATAGPPQLL